MINASTPIQIMVASESDFLRAEGAIARMEHG